MSNKIWLSSPHMSEENYEKYFVEEAFNSNWIAPIGENLNEFEDELIELTKADYAVALSSGTAAIHLGLKALGVEQGDKVACQSFTFSASANPIIYLGAQPVFIDSEDETWNMNPQLLEEALKENHEIKAVIVVNLYGNSAKLAEIKEICERYNVKLLEDSAESLGTKYKGKYTGTFGDVGIYSFNGNKIITTSGGGALITNDKEIADKVRFWASQSREPEVHYEHKELGYNYRMSNVLAGIGRGQLKVLKRRIEEKKFIFSYYQRELESYKNIQFMNISLDDNPNYWLSCIVCDNENTRNNIITNLKNNNIESRPLWKPLHLQPFFSKFKNYTSGTSEDLFEKGLCLPSDTKMTEQDLKRVVEHIIEVI